MKCRTETEICVEKGDYRCCEELTCVLGTQNLPLGIGVCAPLGQPPQPPKENECRKMNEICQLYGELQCCDNMRCVHTGKLPVGLGLCLAI
ncbi:hypothetical protein BVRB_4g091460 [Beta vulgaris subsp. vulgaris]|nr:hypothetical protein BVRB_4g091460 [Beta vulgaris subsp. vulgaris]